MVRVPILSWRVPRNDRALSRRRFLIQVGVIACFVLAWSVQPLWAGQFTEIVAFGDSLTDTGNAFAKSGNTRPDPNYYYQGRWSNGPIWVERLASLLGVPNPTPSLLGGTNNAWPGAETGLTGVSVFGTPNLGNQITNYLGSHSTLNAGQLIVVWGGGNDFGFAGQTDPSVPVANLSQEITMLTQHGGKYFLVPNLLPIGEEPLFKQMGPEAEARFNLLASQFNSLLAAELTRLERTLGITIFRFDVASLFEQIFNDPVAFGFIFTNVTEQAKSGGFGQPGTVVPNPDQYLWWDGGHPTRVANQIIGDRALGAMFSFAVAAPASVPSGTPSTSSSPPGTRLGTSTSTTRAR